MRFMIRTDRRFNNGGEIYDAEIVAKKINGFKVKTPSGGVTFICNDDIEVLSLSDAEKSLSVEL